MSGFGRKVRRKQGVVPESPTEFDRRIAELKRITVDTRDLEVALRYFHDELAMAPGFANLGHTATNELLNQVIPATLSRVLPSFEVVKSFMFQLEEQGFWHGAAYGPRGEFAVYYYFDDLGMGIAHALESPQSTNNHYVRFTGVPIDAPTLPGRGQRGQA